VKAAELAELGRRIRAARLDRGLTQDQLAGLADLHEAYLRRIEKGRANPSVAVLIRIYQALGESIERIFLPLR
jgi:transcriptional regulator with XRE-family HTH domain